MGGYVIIANTLNLFLESIIQPYMSTLGVTPSQVNWILFSRNIIMSISAIFVGWIISYYKHLNELVIISIGHFIYFISYLLFGPSFLLPIDANPWLSVIAVQLIGFAIAASDVPMFECMLKIVM